VGGTNREKNMTVNDLRFVFYTNENNIHFIELTLTYFYKNINVGLPKVTVISNKLPPDGLPFFDKVEYMSGNVEYDPAGKHFGQTLINTLPTIPEPYIFFFCDDYFLIEQTKTEHLSNLLNFIQKYNIDYFGFDDAPTWDVNTFDEFDGSLDDYPDVKLLRRNNQYRYLFSVQPTIWNKQSMLNLLATHPHMSLHNLDETIQEIKDTNKLVCLYNTGRSWFSHNDEAFGITDIKAYDYFIIAYIELVRHGVFFAPENGFGLSENYTGVKFIYKLIDEFDLKNKPKFKKLLHNL
jgi:hypothetical protein